MEVSVLKPLRYQDLFKGSITPKGSTKSISGSFKILVNNPGAQRMSLKSKTGVIYNVSYSEITSGEPQMKSNPTPGLNPGMMSIAQGQSLLQYISQGQGFTKEPEPTCKPEPKKEEEEPKALLQTNSDKLLDTLEVDDYESELLSLIKAGIKNIWLVGPAGCGKTTITKNVAKKLEVGIHVISCGLGTSASEFIGYKYPARENTPFAEYYSKPSIILLDEFTALDPAVAQISNSALANGFIMTTNGKVERHPDCIIIATSNTFGQGANRQYVANNQLDASTIDRFVGGILEMNYSMRYETQYDAEVYEFVKRVRKVIENNSLRRVASTRMLIEGCKLKENKISNWKFRLISNWTKAELEIIRNNSGDAMSFVKENILNKN